MNTSFEAILAALISNNGMAIDCHGSRKDSVRIPAIARLGKDNTVALPDAAYYSMNSMYVGEDGLPYLSTYAMGVMYPEYLTGTLEEAIERYNSPEAHTPGLEYWKLSDLTYIATKDMYDYNTALRMLHNNYGWAVNDIRAKQVAAHDLSPVKIEAVASVAGKVVTVILSGGVNYIRELSVDDDGTVHLTDIVLERNHSVGEVSSAEEFFAKYDKLADKELSFDAITFLTEEAVAA